MIVVGTKPEYLNAVWVKNEWSRFLAMMKKDRHKLLLPCYRDMDPYDMPEALSVLQSYDMSKIGFIQDLTRGIAKVLDADKKPVASKETVVVQQTGGANIAPLLKRVFMFLEDGDWNSANEYSEKVLDVEPECAQAYLGKLMAELKVRRQESLKDQAEAFDKRNNYQKAIRFADDALRTSLSSYIKHINHRNEIARLEGIYAQAKGAMTIATSAKYKEAAGLFESISEYKDSKLLVKECYEKAEVARKDEILSTAHARMRANTITSYNEAINWLESIPRWKNADQLVTECQRKIGELKAIAEEERLQQEKRVRQQAEADRIAREKAEAERKERERLAEIARQEAERAEKKKKARLIAAFSALLVIVIVIACVASYIQNTPYRDIKSALDNGTFSADWAEKNNYDTGGNSLPPRAAMCGKQLRKFGETLCKKERGNRNVSSFFW